VHHSISVYWNKRDAISSNFLRIKSLYMFRALLAHPQEALHKRHLEYCVRAMSVGSATIAASLQSRHSQLTLHAPNTWIPSAVCVVPPEDTQTMLETCTGSWFSINRMKSASRWFRYTDILWCKVSKTLSANYFKPLPSIDYITHANSNISNLCLRNHIRCNCFVLKSGQALRGFIYMSIDRHVSCILYGSYPDQLSLQPQEIYSITVATFPYVSQNFFLIQKFHHKTRL
jgi:hypothetical protein